MSFIQWAVLTVIGIFTLTFCVFTILDRVLKYRENKNNINKQNVDFCMDKMNEKYKLLNDDIKMVDISHEERFKNIYEEIEKLREEMRDMVREMDVKIEAFENQNTNQFNIYKDTIDKELDDILAQVNDLDDKTTNGFNNFKKAIDKDFDEVYKRLNDLAHETANSFDNFKEALDEDLADIYKRLKVN